MARILVIDDEAVVRHAVGRMLTAAGREVCEARDGVLGLSLWHDGGADLVLTDIAMPDMTGFELIAVRRSEDATVPIIAMSGSLVASDLELLGQIKSLGAVLLGKPFTFDQLTAAVNVALSATT
jgi:CheY-like chemotaxis protein